MLLQQGDVLLKKIESLPTNLKRAPTRQHCGKNSFILAEGEVTGHAHTIEVDSDIEMLLDDAGKTFLKNDSPATLIHEEHKNFTIPEGIWEIGIVKEYDHFAEEARKVMD